jgi:hypothetical protein
MASRMVRERTDIAEEIRSVPATPLPIFPAPYSVRFADPDTDAEMLSEWMNRPHLVDSWHYDRPPDQWRRHLEIQFEGRYSRPYIFSLDGRPIGYMELFRAAQDYLSTVYDADPYDVGLHAAIADIERVEKGIGQILFPAFVSSVFEVEPQCRRVVGDTPTNSGAYGRRFWERIGGVFLGEHYILALNTRLALFTWPRTPEDVPKHR